MSLEFHLASSILSLLEIDLHIKNSLFPLLFTIINNISGDLNMLQGLELSIPISGTGVGNCDIRIILTA